MHLPQVLTETAGVHTLRRLAHEILEIRIWPEPRSGFMPLWSGTIAQIHNPEIRLFFTY
jgi:hypothetical protein